MMTMKIHPLCVALSLAFATAACERPTEPPPPKSEAPPAAAPQSRAPEASPAPLLTPAPVAPGTEAGALGPVAGAERAFVAEAAASGLAEVEASRVVASRTNDSALKTFAEQIEREHRSANEELQRIAGAKGIDLPATPEGEPRERLNRLVGQSGPELRRTYLQEFGIEAHQKSIELFERQAREGQDPELRQFAEKTLPALREHLTQAQQMAGSGGAAGGSS